MVAAYCNICVMDVIFRFSKSNDDEMYYLDWSMTALSLILLPLYILKYL